MADPTPEEVARVDEWRREQNRLLSEKRAQEREERAATARAKAHEKLKGRTVQAVTGRVDEYGDWRHLRITFVDGGGVEFEAMEGRELDVMFIDVHGQEQTT